MQIVIPRQGTFDRSTAALLYATAVLALAMTGCGNTVSRQATEQLLASDAVDRTVAQIDFRSLSSKKVLPRATEESGYSFQHPDLEAALRDILAG